MIENMSIDEAMGDKWRPGVHYVEQAQVRISILAAEVRRLRAMLDVPPDARELAGRVFEAVALRVDQFFKAKNIQGGVSCGDDLFSLMDKTVLARAIESYAHKERARLIAAVRGEVER